MAEWMLWKNVWSSGSHQTKPPPFQNGCSPKNFCSSHPCGYMVSVSFKCVPWTTETTFAFSSVFIHLLLEGLIYIMWSACDRHVSSSSSLIVCSQSARLCICTLYSTHTVCTMYYILVQFVCIVEQLQMHWDIMRLTYCERNKFSENYFFQIYIFIKQKRTKK